MRQQPYFRSLAVLALLVVLAVSAGCGADMGRSAEPATAIASASPALTPYDAQEAIGRIQNVATATSQAPAATSTPKPLPSLSTPEVLAPQSPSPSEPTEPSPGWTPSLLHSVLAKGTVREFLWVLIDRGVSEEVWRSYFTSEMLPIFRDYLQQGWQETPYRVSGYEVGEASLLPDEGGYQVKAWLRATAEGSDETFEQEITFHLIRFGQLWKIGNIEIGELRSLGVVSGTVAPRRETPAAGPPTKAVESAAAPPPPAPPPQSRPGRFAISEYAGGPIYVMPADGSALRQVGNGLDPAWSPDGKWIAFVRWTDPRGLYIARDDGSEERLLYGAPQLRAPAWSPDGEWIVFSIQKGGEPAREFCFGPRCFQISADDYWRLAMVRVHDGSYRDLPSDFHSFAPSWSPDGNWVVYAGDEGLKRLNVVTEDEEPVVEGLQLAGPVWSPDGQWIVYQSYQHDHWDLFAHPAWGGAPVQLTRPSALSESAWDSLSPAFSPDGQSVAFATNRRGSWEIFTMKPDGSSQQPLLGGTLPEGLQLSYNAQTERALSWGP